MMRCVMALSLVLALSPGCDSGAGTVDGSGGSAATGGGGTAGGGGGGEAGGGGVAPDAAEPEDVPQVDPEFVLGVNKTGENKPAFFTDLPDEGELNIEFGPQGLWMVVLAFKTRGIFASDAKLLMNGRVDVGGIPQGELALAKQKLVPGGDGWDYYYNFFLVVNDETVAGSEGLVTFSVEDDEGHKVDEVRTVRLTGGE